MKQFPEVQMIYKKKHIYALLLMVCFLLGIALLRSYAS